ncbi:MAG: SDR family oxidoreductase [Desulfatibacillaceae bacterium]|nr:SDR family oxidoreductase [Desulfatibacillaceae bacterium]
MSIFDQKTAVVTGGGDGIGKALCLQLGALGARVIVTGRNRQNISRTAELIKEQGGTAQAVQLDVCSLEAVREVFKKTADEHKGLNFVFNNAGISVAGEIIDLSMEHWEKVIRTNLMGTLHGTTEAYRIMADQGFGHIINISSLAGLLPFPIKAPYCATKHAIVGLSSTLRAEGAALGVKVTVACPGLVATNIWHKTPIMRADNADVLKIIRAPMMTPEKAAQIILKGTAKNKGLLVFPAHAKLLWWAYKIFPTGFDPIGAMLMRDFRKIKKNDF